MTLEERNCHNFLNNGLIYNLLELLELSPAVDFHDMSSDYKVTIWHKLT